MDDVVLVDEYSKRTKFRGTLLARESTEEPQKPQWGEISVWKTVGNQYVLERKTIYRYWHMSDSCTRIGPNQIPRRATGADTYACKSCTRRGIVELGRGFGIEDRVAVDVAPNALSLIRLMANTDGHHSGLAKEVLANVSEQDEDVAALWMEVTVE